MKKSKASKPVADLLDDFDAEGWRICVEIWEMLSKLAHAKEAAELGPRAVATIVTLAERGTLRDTGRKARAQRKTPAVGVLRAAARDLLNANPDLVRDWNYGRALARLRSKIDVAEYDPEFVRRTMYRAKRDSVTASRS
jgi:hypothetical protein